MLRAPASRRWLLRPTARWRNAPICFRWLPLIRPFCRKAVHEKAACGYRDALLAIFPKSFVVSIFQAIIDVLQDFVSKSHPPSTRRPPPYTLDILFKGRHFDANARRMQLSAKNPAHSTSREDLCWDNKDRTGVVLGPVLYRASLIRGALIVRSKHFNGSCWHP